MTLYIVTPNRIITVSDQMYMLTIFSLSFILTVLVRKIVAKLRQKQLYQMPGPGGAQFGLELFDDNELGHIILSCIADEEQYLVRDRKLKQLLFALVRAKLSNKSLIISPNLVRFLALRLIKPNSGIITKIGNFVFSSTSGLKTITAFALGVANGFLISLPYAVLTIVLMLTATHNCYPCEKYFDKLPKSADPITRVYAEREVGNLIISSNDEGRQIQLFVPSHSETKSEVVSLTEVKKTKTTTYQKSRVRPKAVKFDKIRKIDNQLRSFSQLEEPVVPQKPCGIREAINDVVKAKDSLE